MKRRRKERGGGGERVKLDGEEREGKRKDIQKQVSCQLELHVSPLLPSSLPSPPPFSSSSSPSTQLSGAELSPCNLNTHAVNQLPKFLSFSLILFLLYFLSPFPFSHFNSFFFYFCPSLFFDFFSIPSFLMYFFSFSLFPISFFYLFISSSSIPPFLSPVLSAFTFNRLFLPSFLPSFFLYSSSSSPSFLGIFLPPPPPFLVHKIPY